MPISQIPKRPPLLLRVALLLTIAPALFVRHAQLFGFAQLRITLPITILSKSLGPLDGTTFSVNQGEEETAHAHRAHI